MTDVILVLPFGANDAPISYGTTDYQPAVYRADITDTASRLLLKVPAHVAEKFCHNAGFYPMPQEESVPNPIGTVRLYAPDGASWNGIYYPPDIDSIIVIDARAQADLFSFPPICPEASRPEQEPRPWDPEADARHAREIAAHLKEQGRAVAQAELNARDKRIAELEGQLRDAKAMSSEAHVGVPTVETTAPPRPSPSSTPSGRPR